MKTLPLVLLCAVLPAMAQAQQRPLVENIAPLLTENSHPDFDAWRDRDWEPANWKINTDGTAQLQNEEQVVVNPLDPNNLVAVWRDFRLGHREVGVGYSFDGGYTWTDGLIDGPAQYPRHSDPGLTCDSTGRFYLVILSYTGNTSQPNGLFVYHSDDGGVTWSDPVAAVNNVQGVFEDKELIACDRTGGAYDGNVYVSWTRFFSTQIYNVYSTDGGASFSEPLRVSDQGGVQWPVPAVGADGTLYVAWCQFSPPRIRLDRSFSGGVSFGQDLNVTSVYSASVTINGNISTYSFPAMDCDITGGDYNGRLYVAYMDRIGGERDIFLRHSDDQGVSWTQPLRVNDDPHGNGRDQFHPWLCVSPDGVVNIIFYDRRNDPSNYLMDLYLAQSFDGGLSFEQNIRVTTTSSDPQAGSLRAGLIGEYIGLAASSAGRVHPVWTDTRDGNQDCYTAVITDDTAVAAGEQPAAPCLLTAAPNPFGRSTVFAVDGARGQAELLTIYDPRGASIRTLPSVSGAYTWDGRDDAGRPVPAGLYLARLGDGGNAAATKVVLLR